MLNMGDILVLAALGLIIGVIVGNMLRKRRKGGCCGCSSCQGCAMAGKCSEKKV